MFPYDEKKNERRKGCELDQHTYRLWRRRNMRDEGSQEQTKELRNVVVGYSNRDGTRNAVAENRLTGPTPAPTVN